MRLSVMWGPAYLLDGGCHKGEVGHSAYTLGDMDLPTGQTVEGGGAWGGGEREGR